MAEPVPLLIRLHVRAAMDGQRPKLGQVDLFAVDAAASAARLDEKVHISCQTSLPSAEDIPPRTIDQQAVENRLYAGEL